MASQVTTTEVTAKQAAKQGFRKLFQSGKVQTITPVKGEVVDVKSLVEVTRKEVIVKNKHGKRRIVPLTSIDTLTVKVETKEALAAAM